MTEDAAKEAQEEARVKRTKRARLVRRVRRVQQAKADEARSDPLSRSRILRRLVYRKPAEGPAEEE
ncbi:MAG TPA: hypothetical protein VES02_09865 [Dermatophilaceae bacterium]|nr:hypothetical protein [Dermatophilaceae bacterium]